MAASVNKTFLLGNLTRDPHVKYLPSGTAVAEFGMAINERRKKGDQWEDHTVFVDVTLFGRLAEVAGEYLSKGSSCHIEGKLSLDQWEDKASGQKRSKLKVIGESMQMLGSKREPRGEESQVEPESSSAPDVEVPF